MSASFQEALNRIMSSDEDAFSKGQQVGQIIRTQREAAGQPVLPRPETGGGNPILGALDSSVNIFNDQSVLARLLDVGAKYALRPGVGALAEVNQRIFDTPGIRQATDFIYQTLPENTPDSLHPLLGALSATPAFAPVLGGFNPVGRGTHGAMTAARDPEIRQRLNEADSFTERFNIRYEGRPGTRLVTEMTLDPLNLTMAGGLVRQAARGAQTANRARALRNVARGLDVADRIQGAPIEIPMRGIAAGVNRTPLRRLFERSGRAQMTQAETRFKNVLQSAEDQGVRFDQILGESINLDQMNDATKLRILRETTQQNPEAGARILSESRSGELARLREQVADSEDALDQQIQGTIQGILERRELGRSVNGQFVESNRLQRFKELSKVADQLQWSDDELQIAFEVMESTALGMTLSNPGIRTMEEAYSTFRVSRMNARDVDGQAVKGFFRDEGDGFKIALAPNADVTTLPHEALGHLFRRNAGRIDQRVIRERLGIPEGQALDAIDEERFAELVETLMFRDPELGRAVLGPLLERYTAMAQLSYLRNAPDNIFRVADGPLGERQPDLERRMTAQVSGQQVDPRFRGQQGQITFSSVAEDPGNMAGGQLGMDRRRLGLPVPPRPQSAAQQQPSIASLMSRIPGQVDQAVPQRFGIPGEGRAGGMASPEGINRVAEIEQLESDQIAQALQSLDDEQLLDTARAAFRPLPQGQPFRAGEVVGERAQTGITRAGTRPQGASTSGRAAVIRALEEEFGRRYGAEGLERLSEETLGVVTDPELEAVDDLISRALSRDVSNTQTLTDFVQAIRGYSEKQLIDLTRKLGQTPVDQNVRELVTAVEDEFQRRFGQAGRDFMGRIVFGGEGIGQLERLPGEPLDDITSLGDATPSAPLANTPADQVLDRIAVENGLGIEESDRVFEALQPAMEVNQGHFQAVELWNNPRVRRHIEAAMTDAENTRDHVANALNEMNLLWSSLGVEHPLAGKVVNRVRKALGKTDPRRARTGGRSLGRSLQSDERREILAEAWQMDEIRQFQQEYDEIVNLVDRVIQQIPGARQIDELTTVGDLMDARKMANAEQQKTIDKYLRLLGLDPKKLTDEAIESTIRSKYYGKLFNRWQRDAAKKFGVDLKKLEPPEGIIANLPRAWREQALLSPRYHITSVLDMSVKSAIYGINPADARGVDRQLQLWGRTLPEGVRVRETFTRPEFATGREGTTGIENIPILGSLYDFGGGQRTVTIAGKEVPLSVVRSNRMLATAMEDSFRKAAWFSTVRDFLRDNVIERFHFDVAESARRAGVDEDTANAILEDIRKLGIDMSGQQIEELVLKHLPADALQSPGIRMGRELNTIWNRYLDEAFDAGIEGSNRVHFDFSDERVIEEMLRLNKLLGFHFWFTRNIPFYLETLAQNPILLRAWETYNEVAEEHTEWLQLGDLRRLEGKVPDPFLGTLFGDASYFFNPLVVMSIADQTRQRYTPDTENPLGRVINTASSFGFQPAPWVMVPLTEFTPILGEDAESQDILRHTGLIRDVTGGSVDIEGSTIEPVLDTVGEALGDKPEVTASGDGYKDYLISRRLAEMSVEQTGEPNHPDYIAAQGNPDSPLWKEAEQDVERQMRRNAITSFISPFPFTSISPTEMQVRQAQAQIPFGATPWDAPELGLIPQDSIATAFNNVNSDLRQRQITAGFEQSGNILPGNILSQVLRRQVEAQYPWYAAYLQWLEQQPAGAETGVNSFLRAVGSL